MSEEIQNTKSPLEVVQKKFETWRASRTSRRQKIPDELWNAAKDLTQNHSINQIAKALRLNYTDLKKRICPKVEPPSVKSLPHSFIEFDINPPLTQPECIIEMEDRNGAKMKMAFRGQTNLPLIELSNTFWDNGK